MNHFPVAIEAGQFVTVEQIQWLREQEVKYKSERWATDPMELMKLPQRLRQWLAERMWDIKEIVEEWAIALDDD